MPERPLSTVRDWIADAEDPEYEYARHNGKVLRLTRPLAQLLRLMDGRRSVTDLADALTAEGVETSPDEVIEILAEVLVPQQYVTEAPVGPASASPAADSAGGVAAPASLEKPDTPGLWWSVWLLKDGPFNVVARWFAWLFHPWLAVPLFAAGAAFMIWFVATQKSDVIAGSMRDPLLFGQAFLLSLGGILLHEVGHAAACVRQRVRAGHLGFGFYYLFPVCFVDTNAAWTLRPRRRLWIDLGGLYFTLLYSILLAGISLYKPIPAVTVTLYAQAFLFVVNLNPFFRFDGYWALSDVLDLPNLHTQTRTLLEQTWASLRSRRMGELVATLGQHKLLSAYIALASGFFLFFIRNASQQAVPVLLHWPSRLYSTGIMVTQVWSSARAWEVPIVVVGVVSATVTALGTAAALWLYVVRPAVMDLPRLLTAPAGAPRGSLTRVAVALLILVFMVL
jgi:hypothetical protein